MAEKQNALVVFEQTDELIAQAIGELKKSTVTDEALAKLKEQYSNMVIAGIEDMQGYKAVKKAAGDLRKLRTSVEARRKELTEPALKWQRDIKAEADRIMGEIKPIEDKLKNEVSRIDDAKEAARKAEIQRRMKLLTDNGYQLVNGFYVCGPVQIHGEELINITDQQLEFHVNNGKQELARLEAERKRQEEEQARLRAEQEEMARQKAELAKQQAEMARQKAELEAQKKALEKTYEKAVEPTKAAPVAPAPSAPAPEPVAPQPQKPAAEPQKPAPVSPVYLNGFNEFRRRFIEKLDSPEKFTRATLKEWAETIQPQ